MDQLTVHELTVDALTIDEFFTIGKLTNISCQTRNSPNWDSFMTSVIEKLLALVKSSDVEKCAVEHFYHKNRSLSNTLNQH